MNNNTDPYESAMRLARLMRFELNGDEIRTFYKCANGEWKRPHSQLERAILAIMVSRGVDVKSMALIVSAGGAP